MQRSLWKLVLISSFGRNSNRPIRVASLRILAASTGALVFGILLAMSIWRAALPQDLPKLFTLAVVTSLSLILSALLQLPLSSGAHGIGNKTSKLLIILPITKPTRWFVKISPALILNLFFLAFSLPIVIALSHAMLAPVLLAVGFLIVGSLIGISYTVGSWPKKVLFKVVLLIVLILTQAKMLEMAITHPAKLPLICAGILVFDFLLMSGFLTAFRNVEAVDGNLTSEVWTNRLFHKFIKSSWFVLKVTRNRRTRTSFIFCLLLSLMTSIFIHAKHITTSSNDLFFLLALLTTTFVSDIRGISRKQKTPEIIALRGVEFFINSEVLAAWTTSILIGLPIYILILINGGSATLSHMMVGLAMQFGATIIGLLLGTIFVSQAGDIGSQFFASFCAASAVFALPKLIDDKESNIYQLAAWLLAGTASWLIMYIIEFRRRNYDTSR